MMWRSISLHYYYYYYSTNATLLLLLLVIVSQSWITHVCVDFVSRYKMVLLPFMYTIIHIYDITHI